MPNVLLIGSFSLGLGIGYNLDMANLPAKRNERADQELDLAGLRIAERLIAGETPYQMARRVHPHDRNAMRRLRYNIERRILSDNRIASKVHAGSQLTLLAGLGPASIALMNRAARGRPDAIKLLYEATGFHNPRVKHEHSGDIKIKLEMPRPKFDADATVADAEVVD